MSGQMNPEVPETDDPVVDQAVESAAQIIDAAPKADGVTRFGDIEPVPPSVTLEPGTPMKYGASVIVEPGSDVEKLAAHKRAQAQALVTRLTPPQPEATEGAGAVPMSEAPVTPNVVIGPPPSATPEQAMAELPPGARFQAPEPVEAAPLYDPNLPEQRQPIKITTITGN